MRELLERADTAVVIGGHGPDGLAVLRFSPAIWTDGPSATSPSSTSRPLAAAAASGARRWTPLSTSRASAGGRHDLATSEDDEVARALYERMGFSNREGKPDGPVMYVYEREL